MLTRDKPQLNFSTNGKKRKDTYMSLPTNLIKPIKCPFMHRYPMNPLIWDAKNGTLRINETKQKKKTEKKQIQHVPIEPIGNPTFC